MLGHYQILTVSDHVCKDWIGRSRNTEYIYSTKERIIYHEIWTYDETLSKCFMTTKLLVTQANLRLIIWSGKITQDRQKPIKTCFYTHQRSKINLTLCALFMDLTTDLPLVDGFNSIFGHESLTNSLSIGEIVEENLLKYICCIHNNIYIHWIHKVLPLNCSILFVLCNIFLWSTLPACPLLHTSLPRQWVPGSKKYFQDNIIIQG